MKIKELYPDVITEDFDYEYKAELNSDNPVKWTKTIVAYANGKGGVMFVGVSNNGEAFGIGLDEIDKTKNLIARINDRHIFPHARIQYMMRSVDANAEHFVLAVHVVQADSILRYREGDFNEKVYIKGDGMLRQQLRRKLLHCLKENMEWTMRRARSSMLKMDGQSISVYVRSIERIHQFRP